MSHPCRDPLRSQASLTPRPLFRVEGADSREDSPAVRGAEASREIPASGHWAGAQSGREDAFGFAK